MLQNAYLLAKIGADTAENEQIFPKFAGKILQNSGIFIGTAAGRRSGPRARAAGARRRATAPRRRSAAASAGSNSTI